jgi:mannose-6-phosphate isomerase-like protein (cupin superfamily)
MYQNCDDALDRRLKESHMNLLRRFLLVMGVLLYGTAWADTTANGVLEALRWAKQAEASGAERERERFTDYKERALQLALDAGARTPDHRLAEGVHALLEARALGHQDRLADGRENLQSAIMWLSRAAGLPATASSADWSVRERQTTQTTAPLSSGRKDSAMDHFLIDIEEATTRNDHFRQVLFTAPHSQLVLMSLKPGEEIGTETHHLDQFIRIEAGEGTARLNGQNYPVKDGSALVIPAGTEHNVINDGEKGALKLYTIYSPPEHKDGTVHRTKAEAEADHDDHFDGKTTAMLHEVSR